MYKIYLRGGTMYKIYQNEALYQMGIDYIVSYEKDQYSVRGYLGKYRIEYTDGFTSWGDDTGWLQETLVRMERLQEFLESTEKEGANDLL